MCRPVTKGRIGMGDKEEKIEECLQTMRALPILLEPTTTAMRGSLVYAKLIGERICISLEKPVLANLPYLKR